MNARMIGFLLAVLVASTTAFAQTQAPLPIYGNQLAQGWDSWSWAEVTLGVRANNDERPIQVNADAWEALYLHHAPFSTSGYSNLSFWINGGQGGQTLSVIAFDAAGQAINDRPFRFVAPINSWRRIEVPLSEIGAADTTISGFLIQNATPSTAPAFFVNEIGMF
jgi:chitinase